MRKLIIFATAAFFSTSALAGVLPIKGTYCQTGSDSDVVLDANGVGGVFSGDGCTFKAIVASGPHWWIVAQDCNNTDDAPTARIELKGRVISVADYSKAGYGYQEPFTLHRCHPLPAAE